MSEVDAAGVATDLTVAWVRVDEDGRGFVRFQGTLEMRSDCINEARGNYLSSLAFDAATDGERAIMALALATQASGRLVYAQGTESYTIYGNALEDWSFGVIRGGAGQ